MGLVEKLQRRAAKIGLGSRVAKTLPLISLLAVFLGIAWLLVLPIEGQFRKTYISENALLPAQAQTYFRESEWTIVRGYREEVRTLANATDQERSDALANWMNQIGLKTDIHQWSLQHDGEQCFNGTNVYSILHAPRGAHSEAMVLAAPWINMDGQFNDGGVALILALARYLKRWSLWSKNIIFVVPSDSHFALRSWIQAYHTSLENTAGSIEGALVMDYPEDSDYLDAVEIFYQGLNGQLPNLDLINTAVLITNHEGGDYLRVIIEGMNVGFAVYAERMQTLIRGILSQLTSGIGRGHGAETFSGWRIDAITIRARGTEGPMDITTFGRIAESTLRSINNLLEHFHQSFFFYLLLAPRKFVSIGTYLPSAMLVANSFSLMALFEVIQMWNQASFKTIILKPMVILLCIALTCTMIGKLSLVVSTPSLYGFFVSCGVGLVTVRAVLGKLYDFDPYTLTSLHSMSMIFLGLSLTTLASVNFSLSLVLGFVTVPLAWVRPATTTTASKASMVPSSARDFNSLLRSRLLLLLSSPWLGLYVLSLYMNKSQAEVISDLVWGWRGLQLWTWIIVIGLWLPVWIVGLVVGW